MSTLTTTSVDDDVSTAHVYRRDRRELLFDIHRARPERCVMTVTYTTQPSVGAELLWSTIDNVICIRPSGGLLVLDTV